jgi:hypothetical protein
MNGQIFSNTTRKEKGFKKTSEVKDAASKLSSISPFSVDNFILYVISDSIFVSIMITLKSVFLVFTILLKKISMSELH